MLDTCTPALASCNYDATAQPSQEQVPAQCRRQNSDDFHMDWVAYCDSIGASSVSQQMCGEAESSMFVYVHESLLPAAIHDEAWLIANPCAFPTPYDSRGRLLADCTDGGTQGTFPFAIFDGSNQHVVRAGPCPDLEVFWLGNHTGWGVRTLRDIEFGEFICEYAGEVLSDAEAETRCTPVGRDAYLFNLTTPAQWQLLGARAPPNKNFSNNDFEPAFVIDAYSRGNIGRFLNHACGPSAATNLTPVFVFVEQHPGAPVDARLPRVAFFANRFVTKGQELRYDYDMQPDDVADTFGSTRSLICERGTSVWRGRIY